ncbi:MAG: HAD hydrolase-like protein [Patescibacteria group bacterium]|nr:HAD hydrolase-like protein [Patescibacteria group bacterium]MDD5715477.1 HAD hydrolase-like protein [Patescibacteria group bacterium]
MNKKHVQLIIFDFNGVTVIGDHKKTSRHFAKIHGTPWQAVFNVLYTKYFNLIAENKITERQGWIRPIRELGWRQDWRAMRAWHLRHTELRRSVVQYVTRLRHRGYTCIILSKNLVAWFAYFDKALGFKKYFDDSINTQSLNLPKASKKTVAYICRRFRVKPSEIVYIDDQAANLVEPSKMGVNTILYKNFKQMRRAITRAL